MHNSFNRLKKVICEEVQRETRFNSMHIVNPLTANVPI